MTDAASRSISGLLPDSARARFVDELEAAAVTCIASDRIEPLRGLLDAWRSTAEAYADTSVTATGEDLEYLDVPEAVSRPEPIPEGKG